MTIPLTIMANPRPLVILSRLNLFLVISLNNASIHFLFCFRVYKLSNFLQFALVERVGNLADQKMRYSQMLLLTLWMLLDHLLWGFNNTCKRQSSSMLRVLLMVFEMRQSKVEVHPDRVTPAAEQCIPFVAWRRQESCSN